jgi:hypothetical protein
VSTSSNRPAAILCEHGFTAGNCTEEGCLYRREVKNAILGLAGSMTAASDQAQAMTDAELGTLLTTGRYSTIEVHEAGRRLIQSDALRVAALEVLDYENHPSRLSLSRLRAVLRAR